MQERVLFWKTNMSRCSVAKVYSKQCFYNDRKLSLHSVRVYFRSGFETWPRKRGTPCLSVLATILGWSKFTGTVGGPITKQQFDTNIAVAAAASAPSSSTFNKMNRRAHDRGVPIIGIML